MVIPENKFLGYVCNHNHYYPGTFGSLRYKKNRACCECTDRPLRRKRALRKLAEKKKQERLELTDSYVTEVITAERKIKKTDVTPEMIEQRRNKILAWREKLRALKEQKANRVEGIPAYKYLGNLCKKGGHEHLSTGFSLRYMNTGICCECGKSNAKKYKSLKGKRVLNEEQKARARESEKRSAIKARDRLTDYYVKSLLMQTVPKPIREEITQEAIITKRKQILEKRKVKIINDKIKERGLKEHNPNIPPETYLGVICKHGHRFSTWRGLRLRRNDRCCECHRLELTRCKSERENLTDIYITTILTADSPLTRKDITPELISLKRATIKLTRRLRNEKNHMHS